MGGRGLRKDKHCCVVKTYVAISIYSHKGKNCAHHKLKYSLAGTSEIPMAEVLRAAYWMARNNEHLGFSTSAFGVLGVPANLYKKIIKSFLSRHVHPSLPRVKTPRASGRFRYDLQ